MIGTIAKLWGAAALVAGASLFAETAAEQPPVPSSETGQENAGGKMAGNLLSGTLMPQIPSNISITNDGAIRVEESRKVIFEGPHVHMVTDTGVEVLTWKPAMPPSRRKTSASLSLGFPRTGYACIQKTGFLSRT